MTCGRLCVLALAALLPLTGCGGGDWPEYASQDGRYKVRLPGTPADDKDADLPKGVHKVSLRQRSGSYAVAYHDLPEGSDLSADERLDRACGVAVRVLKAKLVSQEALRLRGGYPGRELVAEYGGGKYQVRGRLFLVGRRLYQVLATGEKWWAQSRDVTRFLDSFAVTDD